MASNVSNKIINIFNSLRNTKYKGNLRCQHFSVAIRGNRVITPVLQNHFRTYVFGKKRGTMHAEMNSLKYLINSDKSVCGYVNNKYRKGQYVLHSKVTPQVD